MERVPFLIALHRVFVQQRADLLRATYSFNAYQNTMFTGVIFICNYYMRLKRFTLPKKTESVRRRRLELPGGCARELKCNTIVPCCDCHSARSIGFICFSRSISVVVISSRNVGGSRPFASLGRMPEGWFENWFCFFKCCTYVVPRVRWTAWDMPMMNRKSETWFVVAWSCSQIRYVQRNYVGESYCTYTSYTTVRTDMSLMAVLPSDRPVDRNTTTLAAELQHMNQQRPDVIGEAMFCLS